MPLPINHSQGEPTEKVSLNIRRKIHWYFRSMVVPHGFFQSIGAEFFECLYAECVEAGITEGWELGIDKIEQVAQILKRFVTRLKVSPVQTTNLPHPATVSPPGAGNNLADVVVKPSRKRNPKPSPNV